MRIRRTIAMSLLCLALIAGGWLIVTATRAEIAHRHFERAKQNFQSVRVGDSKQAVIGILGEPNDHDGECVEDFHPSTDCASELIYSDPYELLMGNLYVIDFSAQGRVIGMSHIH